MLEAGIAVLADRLHPIVEFELRRQQVRRVAVVFAPDADERVRLVGACAQDDARSMIFERPSDEVHAIGAQGRGARIALQSRHRLAVECEAQRPGTVERSEGPTSELQSLMRTPYAGICLIKKNTTTP